MKTVISKLTDAGMRLEKHCDHCAPNEKDEKWLRTVSENNWVVLTKDEMIGHRPLERDALLGAGGKAFIVCSGALKAEQIADIIIAGLPEILKVLARHPDTTFIAKISKQGKVYIWKTGRHLFT